MHRRLFRASLMTSLVVGLGACPRSGSSERERDAGPTLDPLVPSKLVRGASHEVGIDAFLVEDLRRSKLQRVDDPNWPELNAPPRDSIAVVVQDPSELPHDESGHNLAAAETGLRIYRVDADGGVRQLTGSLKSICAIRCDDVVFGAVTNHPTTGPKWELQYGRMDDGRFRTSTVMGGRAFPLPDGGLVFGPMDQMRSID